MKRDGANVTVLFSHGNSEDLNTSYSWLEKLAKQCNVNVLGYDYTGYGPLSNEGRKRRKLKYSQRRKLLRRHRSCFRLSLAGEKDDAGTNCFVWEIAWLGSSCYLAAKTAEVGRPVAGLLLHSLFLSIYRVLFDFGVTILDFKFPNIDRWYPQKNKT